MGGLNKSVSRALIHPSLGLLAPATDNFAIDFGDA